MKPTNPSSSQPSRPNTLLPPTREQIAALAHAIWIDRGCPAGTEVANWLEAERQLTGTNRSFGRDGTSDAVIDDHALNVDEADAGTIDREMEQVVSPPPNRSPTSL
jgi:hypothetical protein